MRKRSQRRGTRSCLSPPSEPDPSGHSRLGSRRCRPAFFDLPPKHAAALAAEQRLTLVATPIENAPVYVSMNVKIPRSTISRCVSGRLSPFLSRDHEYSHVRPRLADVREARGRRRARPAAAEPRSTRSSAATGEPNSRRRRCRYSSTPSAAGSISPRVFLTLGLSRAERDLQHDDLPEPGNAQSD
jgi:hypothetical protein